MLHSLAAYAHRVWIPIERLARLRILSCSQWEVRRYLYVCALGLQRTRPTSVGPKAAARLVVFFIGLMIGYLLTGRTRMDVARTKIVSGCRTVFGIDARGPRLRQIAAISVANFPLEKLHAAIEPGMLPLILFHYFGAAVWLGLFCAAAAKA